MSGVRLHYDDIIVECCEGKSQHRNKELAFKRLENILTQKEAKAELDLLSGYRKNQNKNKGKRGNYQRNYNFPRNEITQDGKKYNLSKFLKSDLREIYNV